MNKVVPKNEEYVFEGKVAISQTDLKGNITFVNRKFCEISGYSLDELINSSHSIIKHPDVDEAIYEKMWKTLGSGQVYNGMLKNLRKDGSYYWTDIEIAPILDKKGQTTGYISVSKPSPRKNIQENERSHQNADNK
ncbi:MAG: aerotaxis receptor Aer [Sulfurimonas sp. RIFCSPLOWO2_12_FULL_36_74]|uniref:PAS domain-containing protein n=1 Tax=Sulfurimonas sp. RIFCSPLOWO2_12_36_12 TaxID=1802253 RepID=UPI0008B0D503|nr:PAS domain S-box protein [Sulfurimonas sp. RIFCSPLOWO2_12_36_12]OHE00143.1 MAG: aerotaxis receptor Aer [Sulfurimonas sp. RIFCSPLOWO2_02_FULL_36_28]OHE02963.1 MAG: aerotaxis receptor Aer [Sulfurimonas sp. RIFCSPLOWO2_12_36_12]OHE07897.1 MAG: aerotaxis receptor Aer [Sulfurimonas sp. RIFCSPLOWO2_12_FULL_36_74]